MKRGTLNRGNLDRLRALSGRGLRRLPPRAQYVLRRGGGVLLPLARRAFDSPMAQPLVSVVVPVYNVEAFLPECLDSLIGQTYRRLQIICVDDGSPDDSIDILRAYAGRDPRVQILRQANAGLGAARNVGAARARGRYLMFLDSDDVLQTDAIATYVRSLRRTGSDFAVSSYRRMNAGGTWPAAYWIRQAHTRTRPATTLAESPDILVNAVAWSKCYRRDFWNRHRFRFPEGVLYEDQAVSARAYALAGRFDLLSKVTVNWRVRHDRSSITQQRVAIDDLRARLEAAFSSLAELSAAGSALGHDVRLAQLLGNDFPLSIKSAQHADDEFWRVLADGLRRLVEQAGPRVWERVPAQHRLAIRLVIDGLRDEAIEFVGLGHDNPKNWPTLVRDGAVYAQFGARAALGLAEDDPLLAMPESQLDQVTGISAIRWLEDGRLELRGWAYIDNVDAGDGARLTGVLTPLKAGTATPAGRAGVRVPAESTPDPAVTAASRHRYADYENCCFTLVVDVAGLPRPHGARDDDSTRWRVDIGTEVAGVTRQGPLRGLRQAGSGGRLPGTILPDGRRVTLSFSNRDGLIAQVEPAFAVLGTARLADRRLELTVHGRNGFVPRQLELRAQNPGDRRGGRASLRTPLRALPGGQTGNDAGGPVFRGSVVVPDPATTPATVGRAGAAGPNPVPHPVPAPRPAPTLWSVRVIGIDGRRTPLGVVEPAAVPEAIVNPRLRTTAHRNLGVIDEPQAVRLDGVEVLGPEPPANPAMNPVTNPALNPGTEPGTGPGDGSANDGSPSSVLRLRGVLIGGDGFGDDARVRIAVRAPHAASRVEVRPVPGGRFEVDLPLSADPWGHGRRPLPSGDYAVAAEVGEPTSEIPVELTEDVISGLPRAFRTSEVEGSLRLAAPVGLALTLTVPLATAEIGARRQEQLQNRLAARVGSTDHEPGAVLFRSYFGETCSCNPLAVHRELRRRGTDHTLYWAVKDHSVEVPEGGVPVIHDSAEWYRLLHDAEYYMDNMHQPIYHRKPAHQVQIQTFHGYPFKQMGLSHWAWLNRDAAHIRSFLERAADWDYLVSPASYGTEALVREFGFPNEVLEIGYPRNDVLQSPEADGIRARVRERLGIRPDQRAVLYGPTFRDHLAQNDVRAPMVDFLDTRQLATELGPDWVIMVRGHAFNARVASRLGSRGTVLDVTDYPDINDLVLASDCAVLDYSSLRFDYALTGKPMLFMVPDLKLWSESSRGTLFDYDLTAPGPKLLTTAEVAAGLADLDRIRDDYADAYTLFRKSFCDLDDGHAAERLVDRVF